MWVNTNYPNHRSMILVALAFLKFPIDNQSALSLNQAVEGGFQIIININFGFLIRY